ncbi:Tyrosine recombinase XerD [bioreactor metagenome]|uniref:Tyrosine recombinase XerD n=1 Tax=bioreactor metagenome TaxID=1076179 RepID=A0A644X5U2_9ZZZZ
MPEVAIYMTNHNNIIQFPKQKLEAPRDQIPKQKLEAPRDQTMTPIESRDDVNKIVSYCLNNGKLRDAMLFVIGFNTGLRVSDLIRIQIQDVLRDGQIVESFRVREIKTSKPVTVYINQAAKEMLTLYMEHKQDLSPESYLFENLSYCSSGTKRDNFISRQAAWKIVKGTIRAVGIEGKYGTHTLRKTPSMQIMTAESLADHSVVKNEAGLQAVQMFLNHNSISSTFHYVGILGKQLKAEVMRLNLGLEAIQKYKEEHNASSHY